MDSSRNSSDKGKGKAPASGEAKGSSPDFAANKPGWGLDQNALRRGVIQEMNEEKGNNVRREDRIDRQKNIYEQHNGEYNLLITIISSDRRQEYQNRYQEIQSNFNGDSDTKNWQTD